VYERNERHVDSRRTAAEQSDYRKRTLLTARRQRPSGRREAEKGNEIATPHGLMP
jgi:hypothetical protein